MYFSRCLTSSRPTFEYVPLFLKISRRIQFDGKRIWNWFYSCKFYLVHHRNPFLRKLLLFSIISIYWENQLSTLKTLQINKQQTKIIIFRIWNISLKKLNLLRRIHMNILLETLKPFLPYRCRLQNKFRI